MVMNALDFAKSHPNPTEQEIREALEGNLCRCTGYHNIVKASCAGAQAMATASSGGRHECTALIGARVQRKEDYRFLTGAGQYTDDVDAAATRRYAAFVRSPHAHALIKKIDTRKGEEARPACSPSSPATTSPPRRSAACPAAG